MKTRTILAAILLLCATVAVAQVPNITFSDLNGSTMPKRVADGYHTLNWSGFFYVVGYGMGLQQGTHATVGVTGLCGVHCAATISSADTFHLLSAQLAGGWGDNTLTVMPTRNGVAVGVFVFQLTTTPTTIDFTQYWTDAVDSVIFTPSAGAVVYNNITTDTN